MPSRVLALSLRCRRVADSKRVLVVGLKNRHSQQWLCGSVHRSYHLLTHPEGRNGQETRDSITRKLGEEESISAPLARSPHLASRGLVIK